MLTEKKLNELLFPHSKVREIQSELILDVEKAIANKQSIVMHAPTGLGKTASTLPIALYYALKNKLTVFFLTSRHTQHKIAIDTLREIKNKHKINFNVADIIGKKWMCLQPNAHKMYSSEFSQFCKSVVEEKSCEYYANVHNTNYSLTTEAKKVENQLEIMSPVSTEKVIDVCKLSKLCPYEIALQQARKAKIVIADYNYVFNPGIQKTFFNKAGIKLEDSIVIVDEAHNLPVRIRDSMTQKLSTFLLVRAIAEAKKYQYNETAELLEKLHAVIVELGNEVRKDDDFIKSNRTQANITNVTGFDEFVSGDKVDSGIGNKNNNYKNVNYKNYDSINNGTTSNDEITANNALQDKKLTAESLLTKQKFVDTIEKFKDYKELLVDLEFIATDVLMKQKHSFISIVHEFLESWHGEDTGFARILTKLYSKNGINISIAYRCLDPAIITAPIFAGMHSSILMSGTLNPTSMYVDILGLSKDVKTKIEKKQITDRKSTVNSIPMPESKATVEKIYPNPFPKINRLTIIVPETTTKFTQRSEAQFQKIASICAEIINAVPGNSAVFFPSYYIRDTVYKFLVTKTNKLIILEIPTLSKQEKNELLEKFKDYSKTGAVLLAVSTGSFGEGIDLPGNLLKCVVVVGLPLSKPDLETTELIKYYDAKFQRGWDYGYIMPAFNKCIQTAGRCIRSESDRGVIVFLDERFTWANYYKCFPRDWKIDITRDYIGKIRQFFECL